MSEPAYLPDVNILFALSDPSHVHHRPADNWRLRIGKARFLLCPITEGGFVRLMANPAIGGLSMSDAILLLHEIVALPHCENLSIEHSWLELIQPLIPRLHDYRQVTDALLLGLAIRNGAIPVTLDRRIQALAARLTRPTCSHWPESRKVSPVRLLKSTQSHRERNALDFI